MFATCCDSFDDRYNRRIHPKELLKGRAATCTRFAASTRVEVAGVNGKWQLTAGKVMEENVRHSGNAFHAGEFDTREQSETCMVFSSFDEMLCSSTA